MKSLLKLNALGGNLKMKENEPKWRRASSSCNTSKQKGSFNQREIVPRRVFSFVYNIIKNKTNFFLMNECHQNKFKNVLDI